MSMKVLQIGLGENPGGVENFVFNYAGILREEGITFDYVDLQGKGLAREDELRRNGSVIYRLKDSRKHPFSAARRIREIVRDGEYACVHVNMLSAANPVPVVAALQAGARVIVHSHNTQTVGLIRRMLHRLNLGFVRFLPVIRLACGQEAGKWLFGRKPFTVIPNAVDTERFRFNPESRQKLRGQLCVGEDTLLLGFVGRLFTQKNPEYLVKILLTAKQKISGDVKLLIVGDGERRESLLAAAAEAGMEEDILCVGVRSDTAEWYSAMDAFVLPSLWEGLPLVAVEAQTSGLFCVFSDTVTADAQLTDRVRFCALTESAENWAEALMQGSAGTETRAAYGDRVGETAFSIRRSAALLRKLYASCEKREWSL